MRTPRLRQAHRTLLPHQSSLLAVVCRFLLLCCLACSGSALLAANPEPEPTESTWLTEELGRVSQRIERALVAVGGSSGTDQVERARAEADSLKRHLDNLAEQAARRGETLDGLLAGKVAQLRRLVGVLRSSESGQRLPGIEPDGRRGARPIVPGWLGGGPANDSCTTATVISLGVFAVGSTASAGQDGQGSCGASLFTADVWYRYSAKESGQIFVEIFGADYDSVLSVHTACPGTLGNELACNDDHFGLQAGVSFFAHGGTDYWVRVSGANGETGSFQLLLGAGGVIDGRVVAAADGSALANVSISAYRDGGFAGTTSTAADGSYSLGGLSPGGYVIVAVANDGGLVAELWNDVQCPGQGLPFCDLDQGTVIEIGTATEVDNIDFALEVGGSMTGTVRGADGSSLQFAAVDSWTADGRRLDRAYTDAFGTWTQQALPAGGYYVSASGAEHHSELYDDVRCPGGPGSGACELSDGTLVSVALGETTPAIDFELLIQASVSGTVTEFGTGLPVRFVDVFLFPEIGFDIGVGTTDTEGRYSVGGGIEPGRYKLASDGSGVLNQLWKGIECPGRVSTCPLEDGTPVELVADTRLEGFDFVLRRLPTISGRVISEATGLPVPFIQVRAYRDGEQSAAGFASTDGNGEYLIDELPEGSYRLVTRGSGELLAELYQDLPCPGGPNLCDLQAGTLVPISAGASAFGIDFTMAAGAEVSGAVIELSGGAAVSGPTVEIFDQAGQYQGGANVVDGTYRIAGLEAGTFFAKIRTNFYEDELFDGLDCLEFCDPTLGTPITLTSGQVRTGIDFALRGLGSVVGTVTSIEGGLPIVDARVNLYDVDGRLWNSVFTLVDGSFRFENVRAGNYFALTRDSNHLDELWQDLPCEDSCNPSTGTSIKVVAEQETSGIDFELDRSGSISGRLTDQLTGMAVSGFEVSLYRLPGNSVGSRKSDSEGEYHFSDLGSGTYFILASEEFSAFFINYSSVIYKGLICRRLSSLGCDPFQGTPIVMTVPADIVGIDVALPPRGSVAGRVTDAATGAPLDQIVVRVFMGEESVGSGYTESDGSYLVNSVDSGTYSVITQNSQGYLDELYDDIPCFGGLPSGCNPALGAPVTVEMGGSTRHVDFGLKFFDSGLAGWVTEESSGEALAGVFLDVWDEVGEHVAMTTSDLTGRYRLTLAAGTYYVTTDNGDAFIDEVFDDVRCAGPALAGLCDPTRGTVVEVLVDGIGPLLVDEVNFALAPAGIFGSGFETGNTDDWTETEP